MTFTIRRAELADLAAIADAHVDSIRSIGPRYYDSETVRDWMEGISPKLYADAMSRGELFFIAVRPGTEQTVLGFSSHRIDGDQHGTSVYVRGSAARQGIGRALFRAAEGSALAAGAASLEIDATLAAVEFWKTCGFEEAGARPHALPSGRFITTVLMRKRLR